MRVRCTLNTSLVTWAVLNDLPKRKIETKENVRLENKPRSDDRQYKYEIYLHVSMTFFFP
jgi:hypothetical protein